MSQTNSIFPYPGRLQMIFCPFLLGQKSTDELFIALLCTKISLTDVLVLHQYRNTAHLCTLCFAMCKHQLI